MPDNQPVKMDLRFPLQISIPRDPKILPPNSTDCVLTMPATNTGDMVLMMPYELKRLACDLNIQPIPTPYVRHRAKSESIPFFDAYETFVLMVASLSVGIYLGANYGH